MGKSANVSKKVVRAAEKHIENKVVLARFLYILASLENGSAKVTMLKNVRRDKVLFTKFAENLMKDASLDDGQLAQGIAELCQDDAWQKPKRRGIFSRIFRRKKRDNFSSSTWSVNAAGPSHYQSTPNLHEETSELFDIKARLKTLVEQNQELKDYITRTATEQNASQSESNNANETPTEEQDESNNYQLLPSSSNQISLEQTTTNVLARAVPGEASAVASVATLATFSKVDLKTVALPASQTAQMQTIQRWAPRVTIAIIATTLAIQTCREIYSWYNGEISGPLCVKNIIDNNAALFGGVAGSVIGGAAGGAAAGFVFGPIGSVVGTVVGAVIGGVKGADWAKGLSEHLTSKFFGLTKSQALNNSYSTLGVPITATNEEINNAYRRLARQYHPDKGGDPEKFMELQTAVELIRASRPDN